MKAVHVLQAAFLALALVCAPPDPAGAATLDATFDEGVVAFEAGEFDRAAGIFRDLRDRYGVRSPDLLANLGAAEYAAGRTGPAIHAFLQAERGFSGTPGAQTAGVNLERVRADLNRRQGEAATSGGFVFARYSDAWTALFGWMDPFLAGAAFLAAWSVVFVSLGVRRLRGLRGPGAVAVTAIVLAIPLGIAAFGSQRVAAYDLGVVLQDRTGLLDEVAALDPALPLPEGLELRVVEVRGGFARVCLSSGRQGWVPGKSLGLLSPGSGSPGRSDPG